jgi:hypothetical protein
MARRRGQANLGQRAIVSISQIIHATTRSTHIVDQQGGVTVEVMTRKERSDLCSILLHALAHAPKPSHLKTRCTIIATSSDVCLLWSWLNVIVGIFDRARVKRRRWIFWC